MMDTVYSKTLYKKDSKDKIRVLSIFATDGNLIQVSGLKLGKMTKRTSFRPGKNIGKSNETTSDEQAVIEAKALVIKKIKEGYFTTEKQAMDTTVILPMLAKDYKFESHKIKWNNCYVQPKFDGMRCFDTPEGKKSRSGNYIDTMSHIITYPTAILDEFSIDTVIVDGELYVHGESFQTNMKFVKKYRQGKTERIQYWIYDIVADLPFTERIKIATQIAITGKNCKVVPTFKVESEAEVIAYHKQFIEEGYEGTMVRWGNRGYELNKRSSNLLKYKDFIDESYKIIDVIPSDKEPTQGIIECITIDPYGNKQTFKCGMKFSHEEREEILINKHKYIGKMAEIRFFEYTDDGLPRFPICHGFRLDK